MENNPIEQNTEAPPAPAPPTQNAYSKPKKLRKYSFLSIFLAIIFTVIVIMLGERLIFDLNRFINPAIDREYTNQQNNTYQGSRYGVYETPVKPGLSSSIGIAREMDSAAISDQRIWFKKDDKGLYMMYKIIIHAAIIIPIFISAFVLFHFKKENHQYKPLIISYMVAAFWLMFHLLGETIGFASEAYPNITIYIVLLVLVLVFGGLAYYTQMRHASSSK